MLLNGSKKKFVGPTTLVSIQLLPLLPILVMLANVSNALHCTKSFPLRIFSAKVTKSVANCGFGHIC